MMEIMTKKVNIMVTMMMLFLTMVITMVVLTIKMNDFNILKMMRKTLEKAQIIGLRYFRSGQQKGKSNNASKSMRTELSTKLCAKKNFALNIINM